MISCLGAPIRHLLMPRDPFQLSSVVTSQYRKKIFGKNSRKSPESFPESLPIWVNDQNGKNRHQHIIVVTRDRREPMSGTRPFPKIFKNYVPEKVPGFLVPVTVDLWLSPTHFVSNIRHSHRFNLLLLHHA